MMGIVVSIDPIANEFPNVSFARKLIMCENEMIFHFCSPGVCFPIVFICVYITHRSHI